MPPTDLPLDAWTIDTHLLPCHAAQIEDVTQGPTCYTASLQQQPPQCASMWGQMGEKWSSLYGMKRDGAGGVACCKWQAYHTGHCEDQPKLTLRAMSGSLATQQQGLVLMIIAHLTSPLGPAPHPGSTVKLDLMVEVGVRWPTGALSVGELIDSASCQ